MAVVEKDNMRALALRGGPWSADEREALLNYCTQDVNALEKLLTPMHPKIDLDRALLRGQYMKAVAKMEHTGVPIDTPALNTLKANWGDVQDELIRRVDSQFSVYEGRTFVMKRFEQYLANRSINWPRTPTGRLKLDDKTFRDYACVYPELGLLRELRSGLSQMRQNRLAVGKDSRNRCMLSPFGTCTGRNAPSTAEFIFGAAAWQRSLIRPGAARGLAYLDYSSQEYGISAYLSGDPRMIRAYESDPYLDFALKAGAVPKGANRQSHQLERERFKIITLAVNYGMGAKSLAQKLGQPESVARDLPKLHERTYPRFWDWSEAAVDLLALNGELQTVFGWKIHPGPRVSDRTIRNFGAQANGAEILRLACILTTEAGIQICAPIHDAILIQAPLDQLDAVVVETRRLMAKASGLVLGGPELRTEATLVRYPDRYRDPRGEAMWTTVSEILGISSD
jgi:hypothetical protein